MFRKLLLNKLLAWVATGIALAICASASGDDDPIFVHRPSDVVINGSKWRWIGALQIALDTKLRTCGQPGVGWDGLLGAGVGAAIERYSECPGTGTFERDVVTYPLLAELFPQTARPSLHERAFVLWKHFEGTDYDCVQWHVCSGTSSEYSSEIGPAMRRCPDRPEAKSALTWGPYGATAGRGAEIGAILQSLIENQAVDVRALFQEAGARGLDGFLELQDPANRAEPYLMQVCNQSGQRLAWKRAFARLGQDAKVRETYEAFALGSRHWIFAHLERGYRLYEELGVSPTEVDYAFIVGRAMHRGSVVPRNQRAAVLDEFARLRSLPCNNSELAPLLRYAITKGAPATLAPADRRARDVVYLLDAQDRGALPEPLPPTWLRNYEDRGLRGLRASNFGLSDSRLAPELDAIQGQLNRVDLVTRKPY